MLPLEAFFLMSISEGDSQGDGFETKTEDWFDIKEGNQESPNVFYPISKNRIKLPKKKRLVKKQANFDQDFHLALQLHKEELNKRASRAARPAQYGFYDVDKVFKDFNDVGQKFREDDPDIPLNAPISKYFLVSYDSLFASPGFTNYPQRKEITMETMETPRPVRRRKSRPTSSMEDNKEQQESSETPVTAQNQTEEKNPPTEEVAFETPKKEEEKEEKEEKESPNQTNDFPPKLPSLEDLNYP